MKPTIKISRFAFSAYIALAALLAADLAVHAYQVLRPTSQAAASAPAPVLWRTGGDALDWSSPGSTPLARR